MATPIQYNLPYINYIPNKRFSMGPNMNITNINSCTENRIGIFTFISVQIELLSNKLLLLTGSINEKLKYIVVKTRFSLGFNETTIE